MIIKSMKQSSPGRFVLELSDGTELRSTLNTVTDFRIFSGKEMTQEEFLEFSTANTRALSRETALEMLSRRPMISRKEMYDKLLHKGIDEAGAEDCCNYLEENRFINDEVYAGALVRHFSAKGYGVGKIRQEFIRRGIDRALWDSALEQLPEENDSLERYISRHLSDPGDKKQIQKVSAALFRRGFSWEEIKNALSEYGNGMDTEDDYC